MTVSQYVDGSFKGLLLRPEKCTAVAVLSSKEIAVE
jgi:hypothetical protein